MLPDGIALNSATAELSGTPSSPGNFSFTVQVNDSTGATLVNQAFTGSVVGLALFVEDGSRVLGANAYVSLAQANAILAQEIRDLTAWNALTPTQQKVQIIAATRWLDDKVVWTGDRKSDPVRPRVLQMNPPLPLQSLGWPRKGAFDRERRKVRDDVVPFQVLRATALLANYQKARLGEQADNAGSVRFETALPPTASPTPIWPRRVQFLALVWLGAICAGAALAYAMHNLKPVVNSIRAMNTLTDFPILGTVSVAFPAKHRAESRRELRRISLGAACLVLALIAALALNHAGVRLNIQALNSAVKS
jgi:hypothetical protein